MVGETGFEPATPWTQTKCATKLRHSPNDAYRNILDMVRKERLELSRREALEPKSSVSTNSTTPAERGGGRRDSNPRQPESQSGALPTELRPPLMMLFLLSKAAWQVYINFNTMSVKKLTFSCFTT